MTRTSGILLASASFVALSCAAVPAAAQSSETEVGEVVITGSRIVRRDFVSNSPIVSQQVEALQATGQINLENALEQLPQFSPGLGENSLTLGGGGRATVNLRNLGDTRNLVLLDGRRLMPSTSAGVIDINTIPQAVIGGVEIISGGASAVYGSDALAGVVNFRTRRDFTGIELNGQYNITSRGDGKQYDLSAMLGQNFAEDRGSAMLAVGYTRRERLDRSERDFFNRTLGGTGAQAGSYTPQGNNLPSQAAVNAVFARYGLAPGAVNRSATLFFNPDGTLRTAVPARNVRVPLGDPNQPSADPLGGEYIMVGNNLQFRQIADVLVQPMKRFNVFGKFDYKLTDTITAYAQLYFVKSHVKAPYAFSNQLAPWLPQVPVTNPFLPADLREILLSRPNPNAPFTLTQTMSARNDLPYGGLRIWDEQFQVYQGLFGLTGEVGVKDWTWDAYGSYGETSGVETLYNASSFSRLQQLFSAPDGGVALCGGYDPFGGKVVRQECVDYYTRTSTNTTNLTQAAFEASTQGGLFDLPAGEVRFAAGLGSRRSTNVAVADPALTALDYIAIQSTSAADGVTKIKEVFGELSIPVLRDLPLVQALTIDPGARYSHYNLTGGVTSWKVEANWLVVDFFRLRGGYQRAVRAPNLSELFDEPRVVSGNIGNTPQGGDPCDTRSAARLGANRAQVEALCVAQGITPALLTSFQYPRADVASNSLSNPDLDPETAKTITFGGVLNSPFDHPLLRTAQVSLDYYKIRIKDQIANLSGVTTMSRCFNLDGSNPNYDPQNFYCQLVVRDQGTGQIVRVDQPRINQGGFDTSGLDFQFDWAAALEDFGINDPGRVNFNLVVNRLFKFATQGLPGTPFQDFADTGLTPKWKAQANIGYNRDRWGITARYRYLDGVLDATAITRPASPNPPTAAREYWDLSGRYDVNEAVELRATVANLLDRPPPVTGGTLGSTNVGMYDALGRNFSFAIRARF